MHTTSKHAQHAQFKPANSAQADSCRSPKCWAAQRLASLGHTMHLCWSWLTAESSGPSEVGDHQAQDLRRAMEPPYSKRQRHVGSARGQQVPGQLVRSLPCCCRTSQPRQKPAMVAEQGSLLAQLAPSLSAEAKSEC